MTTTSNRFRPADARIGLDQHGFGPEKQIDAGVRLQVPSSLLMQKSLPVVGFHLGRCSLRVAESVPDQVLLSPTKRATKGVLGLVVKILGCVDLLEAAAGS